MWFWFAAAFAHPVGDRAATQLSVLTIAPTSVDIQFYAEVPHEVVQMAGGIDAMARELRSGLLLLIDRTPTPMSTRYPSPPPAPGDHTWRFVLHLRADRPPLHTVELQTANLQEADNFFAGDVWVAPGLRVADTSLWLDGVDHSLEWLRDRRHRSLTVTLADPVTGPCRWLEPSDPVRAFDARPAPFAKVWLASAAVPVLVLVLLFVIRVRQSR